MILRRLTTALRKQDWFTVAIETLIVMFGVFLGLQVNNWNEARVERQSERRIIDRLRVEVPQLIDARAEERRFAVFRRASMDSALRKLFEESSGEDITPPECLSIALSHIYVQPAKRLPVVEDLVATGRMDIITRASVRDALLAYLHARAEGEEAQRAVSIDIHQLSLEFPDLIAAGYAFEAPGAGRSTRLACDTEGMRNNQRFLNTLVSNHERFLAYFEAQFELIDPRLDALLKALEAR